MEKPEPGASRAEMSAWMEHDFWTNILEGLDDESSDEDFSDE